MLSKNHNIDPRYLLIFQAWRRGHRVLAHLDLVLDVTILLAGIENETWNKASTSTCMHVYLQGT
jgi:hypothetical protein